MSSGPTLNSRLRVLVAKTYRAEKLYSSVRKPQRERSAPLAMVSETANEIRAREWQKTHYDLRVALNDILSLGNSSEQSKQLLLLKERYSVLATDSAKLLRQGSETLKETTERQEFAHVLKLSLELIRIKARAQSNKAISEELSSLLSKAGKKTDAQHLNPEERAAVVDGSFHFGPAPSAEQIGEGQSSELPANVISLARRRAAGGRSS